MNTVVTKQQMIASLREDFLDRDQDTFVKIRRSGRLGWETLIPAGGSYSDLLRDIHEESDIVKEAYGMARDYIIAMDTPYRVILRLSPETNCTDSKIVYLSTKVFDDYVLSDGQKIDTFLGLAIHEGCHLKYTDFTQMGSAKNRIIANLINILEDERIERRCGEEMPGYANYLKASKYYMFDLYLQRKKEEGTPKELEAPVRLFNAILALIRYPKALNDKDLKEFVDYLWKVREIVKDYPKTPDEVKAAAEAIYEVIKEFFEKESQKEPDNQQGKGQQQDKQSGKEKSTQPSSGEASGEQQEENEASSSLREEIAEALEKLEDVIGEMQEIAPSPDSSSRPMDAEEIANCVKRDDCRLAGICENTIELSDDGTSVLYKATENRESYDDSLRRVRKYIPAIAKTLRGHCTEYAVTYRGMRSGFLDTGKLAEAYQGVQTVYQREGHVRSDRIAVCILIDESGSMYGDKIRAARDLGVLLNEAIATVPAIDLYIYGHTYGDRCRDSYCEGKKIAELQVYREKGYAPKKALGRVDARSGNLDSVAIGEAASRMKKFSSCRKNLMFVITDGAPNERYEKLRNKVKELERNGMDIVAVCIEPNYDPSLLYTHHVKLTDLPRLAIDLGKMIKKAIMKNAIRRND